MKKPPKFLKKYFWDIDFEALDYENYSRYTIERIFEYGDKQAINWMLKNFSRSQIICALQKSRGLSGKSANFWALILNCRKEEVKCLNMSFQEIRKQFWPY